jgi:hypothetical protein
VCALLKGWESGSWVLKNSPQEAVLERLAIAGSSPSGRTGRRRSGGEIVGARVRFSTTVHTRSSNPTAAGPEVASVAGRGISKYSPGTIRSQSVADSLAEAFHSTSVRFLGPIPSRRRICIGAGYELTSGAPLTRKVVP